MATGGSGATGRSGATASVASATDDPFRIQKWASWVAGDPRSARKYEHTVACVVSLAISVALNIAACIACVLLHSVARGFLSSVASQLPKASVNYTYAAAGIVSGNTRGTGVNVTEAEVAAEAEAQVYGLNTLLLQAVWRSLSIKHSYWTSSPAFPGLLSVAFYFAACIPFAVLDLLDLPFIRKYKLQQQKQPAAPGSWWKTIMKTVYMQLAFPVPGMLMQIAMRGPWLYGYNVTWWQLPCMFDCAWGTSLFPLAAPSVIELILDVFLCLFVFDICYFTWHSLHHVSRPLYRQIHKIHHEYYAPFAWVTQYTHSCELFAVASLSMSIPVAMGCHPLTQWVWLVFAIQISIDSHHGYDFPFAVDHIFPCCGGTRHHDLHHQWPKTNFQPFFKYADYALGSDYESSEFAAAKRRAMRKKI